MKNELKYLAKTKYVLLSQIAVLEWNDVKYQTMSELIYYNKKIKDLNDELQVVTNIINNIIKHL
tara:strand:+ start:244 stop:435 length:192 start_codon:yes stop_codon:yes gene_type:complete